jgi:hypothetical protein
VGVVRAAVVAAFVSSVSACQFPDPYYAPVFPDPVYDVPTIAFDRTHENLRAIDGAFGSFAALARADGYRVRDFDVTFVPGCLANLPDCAYWNALWEVDILAMVMPLTPLSDEESAVLALWTVFGGSLLLVPDKETQLVETLLQQFRIEWRLGCPANVLHQRSEGTLAEGHPIVDGRSPVERVEAVQTLGTGCFRAPVSMGTLRHVPILTAGEDVVVGVAVTFSGGRAFVIGDEDVFWSQFVFHEPDTTDAWLDLGLALCWFDGPARGIRECARRVVEDRCQEELGLTPEECPEARLGLVSADNERFVRNVLHWLDRNLPP